MICLCGDSASIWKNKKTQKNPQNICSDVCCDGDSDVWMDKVMQI